MASAISKTTVSISPSKGEVTSVMIGRIRRHSVRLSFSPGRAPCSRHRHVVGCRQLGIGRRYHRAYPYAVQDADIRLSNISTICGTRPSKARPDFMVATPQASPEHGQGGANPHSPRDGGYGRTWAGSSPPRPCIGFAPNVLPYVPTAQGPVSPRGSASGTSCPL